MQKARSFFFVCASLFLLALAYHLGATSATAQAPGNPIVAAAFSTSTYNGGLYAFAANGDAYVMPATSPTWYRVPNVFGGVTPASQPTWGQLKAQYRK